MLRSLGHPHFPKALHEISPVPREWRVSDVPFGLQPTLGCGLCQSPLLFQPGKTDHAQYRCTCSSEC